MIKFITRNVFFPIALLVCAALARPAVGSIAAAVVPEPVATHCPDPISRFSYLGDQAIKGMPQESL